MNLKDIYKEQWGALEELGPHPFESLKPGAYFVQTKYSNMLVLFPGDNSCAFVAQYYMYSKKFSISVEDTTKLSKHTEPDLVRFVYAQTVELLLTEDWCKKPLSDMMYRLLPNTQFAEYLNKLRG